MEFYFCGASNFICKFFKLQKRAVRNTAGTSGLITCGNVFKNFKLYFFHISMRIYLTFCYMLRDIYRTLQNIIFEHDYYTRCNRDIRIEDSEGTIAQDICVDSKDGNTLYDHNIV